MLKKVFVIVVTYNGSKWIDKCFGSLVNSSIPVNILAIDNFSSDDTVRKIQERYPNIEVLQTGANLGFGKANNIGFKAALEKGADYIFLLNQDAWVQFDTIETLIKVAEDHPAYGIISPLHYNKEGNALETKFSEYVNTFDCPQFISDHVLNQLKSIYDIRFINAAAWLISKACLQKVGGFDPLFPHYGEDEDYIERTKLKGYKIGVTSKAIIYHECSFKDWEIIKWDKKRALIFNFLRLKNIGSTYRSNWLSYLKNEFDKQTSLLVFRRFKELGFRINVSLITIKYFNKVRKARRLSRNDTAFLS